MKSVVESNSLARAVREARGELGMREVARRSGLSPAQISRIESGVTESPTTETLTRLAAGLGRYPPLLLVVAGRLEGNEALHLVLPAVRHLPPDSEERLQQASKELLEVDDTAQSRRQQTAELHGVFAAMAGSLEVLKAESVELVNEIGYCEQKQAEYQETPEMAALYEPRVTAARKRLERIRAEQPLAEQRVRDTREQLSESEAELNRLSECRGALVRECAERLFVSVPGWFMGEGLAISPDQLRTATLELVSTLSASAEDVQAARHRVAEMTQDLERVRNQLAHRPGDVEFRRLAAAWNRLTPERRTKVLDFAEDQRVLSVQEQLEKPEEVRAIGESAFAPEKSP